MKRDIEVEAMEGMSCKQVRITNNITNTLIAEHHMCLDCAIGSRGVCVGSIRQTQRALSLLLKDLP